MSKPMSADHSPLPWRPADNGVWDADGTAVAQTGRSLDGQANRDYIVRAANAYPLAEEMARLLADWYIRLLQAAREAGLLAGQPNRRAEP